MIGRDDTKTDSGKAIIKMRETTKNKISEGKLLEVEKIIKEKPAFEKENSIVYNIITEEWNDIRKDHLFVSLSDNHEIRVPVLVFDKKYYVENEHAVLTRSAIMLKAIEMISEPTEMQKIEVRKISSMLKKDEMIYELDERKNATLKTSSIAIAWAFRDYYVAHTDWFSKIINEEVFDKFIYFVYEKTVEIVNNGKINRLIAEKTENSGIRIRIGSRFFYSSY